MNLGFDTFDTFRFKQLIFVNSAAYAYTQVRIDQHTALFGENNLGKTSMLNALKLFLLPEVNFRNCHSKFNFKGTNGKTYDGLASFRYYFPEDRAFIILEAENPHDDFCVVLHRGSATDKQEYSRMVVPHPYQDIEHLFWDMDSAAENGLGAPVEEMTLQRTLASLRAMDGEAISDKKVIQERLFTNQPYDPKAGRYSLLPLRNGAGSREIEAWRKLIHLAFDISAQDKRTLPDTLATIIEGQKGRKQEQLRVDLNAIVEEANELRKEGDRITRIVNATRDWEAFDRLFRHEHLQRQHAAQAYVDLDDSVATEEARLDDTVEASAKDFQEVSSEEERLREDKTKYAKGVTVAETTLKNTRTSADSFRQDINAANATRNAYPGLTEVDILKALDDHIEQQERDIAGYEDKAKAQENLGAAHSRIQVNEREVRRLEAALERYEPTLLDSLSPRDAGILNSLNPELGSTHGELTTEQQQAFKHFSEHFHSEDQHLVLGLPQARIHLTGIPYQPYDAEETRQRTQEKHDELKKTLDKDRKLRDRLKGEIHLSAKDIETRKLKAQKERDAARKDKDRLNAQRSNEEKLKELEAATEARETELADLERQLQVTTTQWKEADQARSSARVRLDEAKQEKNRLERMRQRLDAIGKDAGNVFEDAHRVLTPTPCKVAEDAIESLEHDVRELRQRRKQVEEKLRTLLGEGLLPDVDSKALVSAFRVEEIASFHEQLQAIYHNLETQRANYAHRVEHHNKTTHAQVAMLRDAKSDVSNFMGNLNQEMGSFSISNLEQIRVDYRFHPRFQQLLNDLDKADLLGAELQDQRVYEQLQAFQADFFNKDASRTGILLSLDKILEEVTYSYRLQGEDSWTSNAQSNGTNMMITTNLLSVLMSRLMEGDAQVTIPLVMDEFGSLATRNMRTAREMAERHGYCLFVANPNRDSKITQVLENYVHLGLFHAERAYSPTRSVVHHGLCESLTQRGKVTLRETAPYDEAMAPGPQVATAEAADEEPDL